MDQHGPFCEHPDDPAAYEASLIDAYKAGRLEDHCVTTGLRNGCTECEAMVAAGFRQRGSEALQFACERVLFWSCREDVAAGKAVLERETRGLIQSVLSSYRVNDPHLRDDIRQEAYLAIMKRFGKPKPIEGHISAYLTRVVRNLVIKNWKAGKDRELPEDVVERHVGRTGSAQPVPPDVRWGWQAVDEKLAANLRCDLIHRIMLAQACVLNWSNADRLPTKELLSDWARLGALSEGELNARVSDLQGHVRHLRRQRPAECCAILLNVGQLEVWETPLLFGVCTGLEAAEIVKLVQRLSRATITFVDQRIGWIRRTLSGARGG